MLKRWNELTAWARIKLVLVIVLSGMLVLSSVKITIYMIDGLQNKRLNDDIKIVFDEAKFNNAVAEDVIDEKTGEKSKDQEADKQTFSDQYKQILEINENVIGWINIPETTVNYPIVKGEDNSFYLNHSIEDKKTSRGSIFMDYRNFGDEQDVNRVLYGHNMKDGSMFHDIMAYKNSSFFDQHPYIQCYSLEEPITWQIFSVYIASATDDVAQITFKNEDEYSRYLKQIKKQSKYDTGVEVTQGDQILTLVTCTYENNDARVIVHAVRK
jgi:sortase B